MKEHVDRLFGKLRSSKGETLAELLVSVLVIVLGLTMFATAMMSSKKMLVKGKQKYAFEIMELAKEISEE